MAKTDVELFTVIGRLRLLKAIKEKTGLEENFACESGFLNHEGFSFSDSTMLTELIRLEIDILKALQTPAPNEDQGINARFTGFGLPSA